MFRLNHETVKLSRKTGNALKWWMCFEKIGASPRFAKSLFGMKRAGSMSISWWCVPSMEKHMWKYPMIPGVPVSWWQESLILTVVRLFHLSKLLLRNIPIGSIFPWPNSIPIFVGEIHHFLVVSPQKNHKCHVDFWAWGKRHKPKRTEITESLEASVV